jgi:hypothetical protein
VTLHTSTANHVEAAIMEDEILPHEHIDARRRRSDMPTTTGGAKLDIAATRTQLSDTIDELEEKVSSTVDGVKRKVDAVGLVKRHPWPALAAALVAGIALSASGADRRAARATKRAAKRAPDTAKRGASSAAAGLSHLTSAAIERIKGEDEARPSGGLKAKAKGVLESQVRELGTEVRRGADELSSSAPPPRDAAI